MQRRMAFSRLARIVSNLLAQEAPGETRSSPHGLANAGLRFRAWGFSCSPVAAVLAVVGISTASGVAHEGPHPVRAASDPAILVAATAPASIEATSAIRPDAVAGQPPFQCRYLPEASTLPKAAHDKRHLAHGGFAVDPATGEVFFGLKGVGVIWMNNDLSEKRILPVQDPDLLSGNFHNVTLLKRADGRRFLALPDNETHRVWLLDDQGGLLGHLPSPHQINAYYAGGGAFNPTDSAYAGEQLYVTDGYSAGNYILVADPWRTRWTARFFGGKTTARERGLFGTAHGITFQRATRRLEIADRANSRLQSFDLNGTWLGTTELPAGCLPCDVEFHRGYALVGCLKGPRGQTPAPFYVLDEDGRILSTVTPKSDFGLDRFTHIHNATWKPVLGPNGREQKLWILTTAWNPGDFAVFEVIR